MDEELLREVDDAVRQEKLRQAWGRFGNYIIAASVAIVAVTVAAAAWRNYRETTREEATAALMEAVGLEEDGRHADAALRLSAFAEEHGILQDLAKAREIGFWLEAGKPEHAMEAARALAKSPHADAALKDFSALALAAETPPDAPPGEALAEAAQAGRPFSHTAREMQASLLAAAGKTREAAEIWRGLEQDALTPDTLRKRARLQLSALGGDGEAGE